MNPVATIVLAELREKMEAAIAYYAPELRPEIVDALAADRGGDAAEVALKTFELGVRCATGPAMAEAIIGSLTNNLDQSNAKMAPGVSRAALSKALCRARRVLGLPPEWANQARAGRGVVPAPKPAPIKHAKFHFVAVNDEGQATDGWVPAMPQQSSERSGNRVAGRNRRFGRTSTTTSPEPLHTGATD